MHNLNPFSETVKSVRKKKEKQSPLVLWLRVCACFYMLSGSRNRHWPIFVFGLCFKFQTFVVECLNGKKGGCFRLCVFFSKAKPAANVIHAYQHHSFCISVWILVHQKTCHIKMAESNDRRVIGLSMMEPQIHIKKYRERERERGRDFYLTKRDLWERSLRERKREREVGRCEKKRNNGNNKRNCFFLPHH